MEQKNLLVLVAHAPLESHYNSFGLPRSLFGQDSPVLPGEQEAPSAPEAPGGPIGPGLPRVPSIPRYPSRPLGPGGPGRPGEPGGPDGPATVGE